MTTFNEGPIAYVTGSRSGSSDTRGFDAYRQGVELIKPSDFTGAGLAKGSSGEPGHQAQRTSFGQPHTRISLGQVYVESAPTQNSLFLTAQNAIKTSCPSITSITTVSQENSINGVLEPLEISRTLRPRRLPGIYRLGGSVGNGNADNEGSDSIESTIVSRKSIFLDVTSNVAIQIPLSASIDLQNSLLKLSPPRETSLLQASPNNGNTFFNNAQGTDSIAFGGQRFGREITSPISVTTVGNRQYWFALLLSQSQIVVAPPVITSVSNPILPLSGGAETIFGSGFASGMTLTSDGSPVSVTYVSPNQATTILPARAAGTVNLQVTNLDTQNSGISGNGLVTYSQAATLTSVTRITNASSSAVLTFGTDTVYIDGTGFSITGTTQVEVGIPGNVALYPATVGTTTRIAFPVPALSEGLKSLRVRNPNGQFSGFQYIWVVSAPQTMALSGYWEQRADVNDYSPTDTDGAGPDIAAVWEGRSSEGTSGTRNLVVDATFTTPPTLAIAVNGITPVDFTAVARGLRSALAPSNYMPSTSVFTMIQMVKITAQPGVTFAAGTPAAGEKILAHTLGGLQCAITKEGVTGNVVATFVATDNVGAASVSIAGIPLNTWTLLIGRVSGTSLKMRRGASADANATMLGTGVIVNQTTGELRDADNANGTVIRHELVRSYPGAFTDAQCSSFNQYLSRYLYPSAGLQNVALALVRAEAADVLGGSVLFFGTGFSDGDIVLTNGVARTTTYSSPTKLIVQVPANAAGTVSAEVQKIDGTTSGVMTGILTYLSSTPSSLALSLWAAQGSGQDYNAAGTPPYTSLASTGLSGARTLVDFGAPFSLPTSGNPINEVASVRFGTDLKDLRSNLTLGNFVSNSAFTIAMLIKLDPLVAAWSGTATGTMLFYGTFLNIQAGQTTGLGRVTLHTVSGVDNFINSSTFALNTWVSIVARYDGTNLRLRVNAVDATPIAATNLSAAFTSQVVRMAHPTNGMAIHDRLSTIVSATSLSDAAIKDIHNRWVLKFPETGMSLIP